MSTEQHLAYTMTIVLLKKTLRISDIQFLNYNVLTNIDTVEITALIKMPRDNVTKTLKSRFDNIYEKVKEEILKNAEPGCSIPVEMKMSDLLPLADHETTGLENHIINTLKQEDITARVNIYPKVNCLDIYYML